MNATNALGGSSGHQRTPFLTGIQLGLNFFGKVFCQHCDRRSASILTLLTKICSILFTLFTLSGAVCHTGPKIHKKVNSRISQKVPPDKARNQKLQIFVASRQQLSPCTSCRHLPAQLLIATCFHVTRKMENGPRKVYA